VRRISQAAPVITGSIVAILLVQGIALAVALALLEFILTGRSLPILGAAIVASIAWISWRLVRLLFTQKAADLSSVVAAAARPDEQSRLWDLISTLAREGRGKMPDHVLLGLYPSFYTSAASFKLSGSEQSLHGTALHLSLPLMRLLDSQELESVIRHELAHLSDDDLALTWNLHRAGRQFELASQAIGRMNLLCVIAALPAITLLHFCLACFQTLGHALKQSTELRADERTVAGSDPVVLMSALAKVSFATAFWQELEQTTAAKLAEGSAFINVSETFATGVSRTMAGLGWDGVLSDLDRRSAERLETSHPGIAGRCRNLGISPQEVTARPLKPAKSSLRVIARAEDTERHLSKVYQRHLVQSGHAKLGVEIKPR
jgi:Zn-dependent protease with chaperone function